MFFFWGKFLQLGDEKKRVGESNKGIIEILKIQSPHLDQKNLKIIIFRQCVSLGQSEIPKKMY
jgi:hypothetical protein